MLWAAGCGPRAQSRTEGLVKVVTSREASNVGAMSRSFVLLKVAYAVEALVPYIPLVHYFCKARLGRDARDIVASARF